MMIAIFLLFSSLASAQVSTDTAKESAPGLSVLEDFRIQNISKDVRDLQAGRPTYTGIPTWMNGICFRDSTCQTTAYSPQSSRVSSYTYVADGSNANSSGGVCVPGSTVTITTTALTGPIVVEALSTVKTSAAGNSISMGFLMDGAFVSPYSSSNAAARGYAEPSNGNWFFMSVDLGQVSVGTHNFCWTVWNFPANTVSWGNTFVAGSVSSRFGVKEQR